MILLNNKRLKELESENEDLKGTLKSIQEREEKIRQLEEVQRRLQIELMEMNQKKTIQLIALQDLKKQKSSAKRSLDDIRSEIDNIQKNRREKLNPFLISPAKTDYVNFKTFSFNKDYNSAALHQKDIEEALNEAQSRKDKLIGENIRLEETARELSLQVQQLEIRKENLNIHFDKEKSEINQSDSDKFSTTNEKLSHLSEKIDALKLRGRNELNEIQSRINELTNEENAIQDRINLRLQELDEIENSTLKYSSAYKKASEEKFLSLVVEEQNLIDTIGKLQKQITELKEQIAGLKQLELKTTNEIERRIEKLRSQEIEFKGNINLLQLELNEKNDAKNKADESEGRINALLQEEQNWKDKISQFSDTENIKLALINELNDKLSAKEIEFAALSQDYEKQTIELNEINLKKQKLADEVNQKQQELLAVVQTINSKSERIKELRIEVDGYEEKLGALKNDLEKLEFLNTELEHKINNGNNELGRFDEEKKKIADMIPALQRRRVEIQQGNKALEERFAELFQRLNKEINQANQKRNVLDQIILKKEKDVNEKDQILNEKLGALEDSERVLNLRQAEIDSFDDLLKTINEQKELLKSDLIKLDDTSSERRLFNKDLGMETEFIQRKMAEIEKSIHDLLNTSDVRYQKSVERRATLDNEIKEYESRLNDLNLKIKDSMNELVELRSSVNRIKLEHEEHRLSITKFVSIKKKLDEEIKKNQTLLNKYKQIREKIKIEQTTMTRFKETPVLESNSSADKLKLLTNKDNPEIFKL